MWSPIIIPRHHRHPTKASSKLHHKPRQASDDAVSEVIGTIILIAIGISLFSLLMLLVMNISSIFASNPAPQTNIVGIYDDATQSIIFENRGGEPISLNSTITLRFADISPIHFTVGDYLDPPPGPNDHYWIMGERVVYDNFTSIPNFDIIEIHALIIDPATNSVLLNGVIREGVSQALPYAITGTPIPVNTRTEQFSMTYNFQLYSNHPGWTYWYRYSYRKLADTNWTSFNWVIANPSHGSNGITVTNLTPGTIYVYKAEICWGTHNGTNPSNYSSGITKQFETGTDYVGIWKFQEPATLEAIAIDSTIHHNNGTLIPTISAIKPTRVASDLQGQKAILFDGINDYIKIPNSDSLKIFPAEQTIEAWIKPQEHKEGYRGVTTTNDISQYCQAFENYGFTDPDICSVGPQSYAIVSRGANGHGYLAIINITNTGIIQPKSLVCTIQSLYDFETTNNYCWTPKILHIQGTEYAIVYGRGNAATSANGCIKTINIAPTGTIGTLIGTYNLAVSYFYQQKILPLTGTIYTLFYNSGTPNYQLRITTINIPPAGNPSPITNFTINSLVTNDLAPVQVGSNATNCCYAIAYRDSDSDGYMTCVSLTNTGTGLTQIDQIHDNVTISYIAMFDSDDCWLPSIIPTQYPGYYVIAYTGSVNKFNNYLYVRTFNISSNGLICNASPDHSADFKIIDGAISPLSWVAGAPRILSVDQDTYVVAYQYSTSTSYYGLAQTINIAPNGSISFTAHAVAPPGYPATPSEPKRFTYELYNGCLKPAIIQLPGGTDPYYYAVVYTRATNTTNQGMVKTFSINGNGTINQPCIRQELLGPYHFWNPYLFQINANTFAIVYNTEYNNGITIVTTHITPTGDVADTFLSRASFPSGRINAVRLTNIQGNVYCLMYYNYSTGIVARSLQIAADGTINTTGSNTWTYATSFQNTIDIKKISNDGMNDIYAISFHSLITPAMGSYLITVHISGAGIITGPIDTLTINDPAQNLYSVLYDTTLTRVEGSVGGSDDIFALTFGWCYKPAAVWLGAARVLTIEINLNTGMITDNPKATYDFDTGIQRATLTQVANDVYAIAYTNKTGTGCLKTIRISNDGLTISLIDPGPTAVSLSSQLLPVDTANHIFAVITDTSLKTLRINEKGDISNSTSGLYEDHTFTFTAGSKNIRALKITNRIYAFVYAGTYYDGYLQTLNITSTETKRSILLKAGAYNVSADGTNCYVRITDSASVTHSVTIQLNLNEWNYITVLYKIGTPLKVYINANIPGHGAYAATPENMTLPIAQTTADLYIGGYNAIYDDISIGTKVFSESLINTMYHQMTS